MCWFRLKQNIIKFTILYNYSVAPLIHIKGYEGCLLFTWANGEKYSGLVISFQNSVYHLHKSVPFTEKQPLKPETSIKDEKANLYVPNILSGKTVNQLQMFHCSQTFSTGMRWKTNIIIVPFTFLTVNMVSNQDRQFFNVPLFKLGSLGITQ